MKPASRFSPMCLCLLVLVCCAAEAGETFSRQVTLELTFAQRDLVWLGDPGSPAANVAIKPDAQPVATDAWVTTLMSHEQPARRYLREARIVERQGQRLVQAFTREREQTIGTLDAQGRFQPNALYQQRRDLLPSWPDDASSLAFDAEQNVLYYDAGLTEPMVQLDERLDHLPLALVNSQGEPITAPFAVRYVPGAAQPAQALLQIELAGAPLTLASTVVPATFRRGEVLLGSYDNRSGTYLPESVYRPGGQIPAEAVPSVTFTLTGEFSAAIDAAQAQLVLRDAPQPVQQPSPAAITIDGQFDDWRNVAGIDDPRGDLVPYLEYVPDVDLLEFKVAHDARHLYLYARVAGQVGRTHPEGGRSYFYAYLDVDRNAGTGFLPTRDDDCYFGVDIGDDCEVQFEFVDNTFRKTFYGFCGLGGDDEVLRQIVALGPSQYGRLDEQGHEREHYKAEYTYRAGRTEITEDLKLGTSDTIRLAVSPDGHEVEVVSDFTGFLKDATGRPILGPGQTIDLAAGMESDSKNYPGKKHWGADSTGAIRGHTISERNQLGLKTTGDD